jgi:Protein of unknown function (DUF732)
MRTVLLLAGATAIATAAPAGADPGQDAQFFQVLDKYQLGYVSREDAIDAAGSTCAALDRGVSFEQLETILIDHPGGGGARVWTVRDVRADRQHAAVLAGDGSGVYGEYPPAVK